MAYFVVKLNGDLLARAGAAEITVLDAHVIVNAQGFASLRVGGMHATSKVQEHFEWIAQGLRPGARVELEYLTGGVEATLPQSTTVRPALEMSKELKRIREELEAMGADMASRPQHEVQTWTRAPRPRVLRVSINSSSSIDADLNNEDQLQAVLALVGGECRLEVDSLTVLEDGSTKGTRWLQEQLRPGDGIKIVYVA